MKTYILTSDKWEGEIELAYNDVGLLIEISDRSHMSDEQRRYFLQHNPHNLAALQALTNNSNAKKMLVPQAAVTFDLFWDRYNDKVRSSRVKTRRIWDRMSKSEQLKAYNYVGMYLANIQQGIAKKYATTYLSDQLWNN